MAEGCVQNSSGQSDPYYCRQFCPGPSLDRALIGGCIFVYSCSARLVSFEIKLIDVSGAEPEYMNIHPPPPISVLATALIFAYDRKRLSWWNSFELLRKPSNLSLYNGANGGLKFKGHWQRKFLFLIPIKLTYGI